MKYIIGYREYILKNEKDVFIRESGGPVIKACLLLTNNNLLMFYKAAGESEETLKIFPVSLITHRNGEAYIDNGDGKQPYFIIHFPESYLYVFYGHSVKSGWQNETYLKVQQWIDAINHAVTAYEAINKTISIPNNQNQYLAKKQSFCTNCGSPLSPNDVFCVICGNKV